jgi:hypothetical protein
MSSLPEMRSGATGSKGWSVVENPPIFRAWTAGGDSYGFCFHDLNTVVYSAERERLFIDFSMGTLVVAGPRVLEFYDDFCAHWATNLKADGESITSVTMQLREG